MSLTSNLSRVELTGDGAEVAFPFTDIFIFTGADLAVYLDGVLQSPGVYTVTLTTPTILPSDGVVTFDTAPPDTEKVIIERTAAQTQTTTYAVGGAFPAASHEAALDKLTILAQDNLREQARSPKFATTRAENLDWTYDDTPDLVTPKVPVFNPTTKQVSWSNAEDIGGGAQGPAGPTGPTGAPGATTFAGLTDTLPVADAKLTGDFPATRLSGLMPFANLASLTKTYTGAIARTVPAILDDWKSVKDFGATGDGVTDDTAAIQLALNDAGVIFFPAGNYLISSNLSLKTNTCLRGAGVGATRIFTAGDHDLMTATAKTDISVSDITFEGDHDNVTPGTNTTQDMIRLETATSRVLVTRCRFANSNGRGIVSHTNCTDVIVSHNLFFNCSLAVFFFKGARRCVIDSNVFDRGRVEAIFIDDATTGDTAGTAIRPFYNMVTNNVIHEIGWDDGANTSVGINISTNVGLVISGNLIVGQGTNGNNAATAISLSAGQGEFNSSRVTSIVGNTILNSTGKAIKVLASSDVVITGNTLYNNNTLSVGGNQEEIEVEGSATFNGSTVTISGNSIHNPGGGTSFSDVGIHVTTVTTDNVFIGPNNIVGMSVEKYELDCDAGDVVWSTFDNHNDSTFPTHAAGHQGALIYRRDKEVWEFGSSTEFQPLHESAWVQFDGSDGSIRESHNVNNVTRNSVGDYTVSLTNTMSSINYAVTCSSSTFHTIAGTTTTTTVLINTRDSANTLVDPLNVSVVIHGKVA